jgi:hypothetical protein
LDGAAMRGGQTAVARIAIANKQNYVLAKSA